MERQKAVSKMFFVEIGKYIFLLPFISEFRNLNFPELENWELEVPGTWELRNLFKGIPRDSIILSTSDDIFPDI